jgi:hypothetical protein
VSNKVEIKYTYPVRILRKFYYASLFFDPADSPGDNEVGLLICYYSYVSGIYRWAILINNKLFALNPAGGMNMYPDRMEQWMYKALWAIVFHRTKDNREIRRQLKEALNGTI